MDGKKVYQIQINGISESASAVESLNKQLDELDKRIKELGSKNIKIDGGSVDNSAIKEQVAKQKELNQLKKEEAAQQRLIASEYDNTMKGMKQNLADLKTVINATDLGDSDSIKNMTKDANALTNKLKEMEQAYGQFGRNVGNYRDAANGFKGLAIQVGDVTQKFDNAKQALKTLQGELRTLQVKKDQGVLLSEEELKRFQELPSVVAQLKSSIQDAGKPMDALMDTMQSFVAIAQTTKGLSAFFGFDDSEIQRSIQQLLALQNALQGFQTIQKQLQSGEGIGKLFKAGDAAIKSFTDKLFGVNKAAKAASVSVATVGTAGKTAATGLGTASVAANTTAKSFSLASAAATALRVVLNALGIGLVIGAISVLVSAVGKLIDKQQEAKKYQEDLNKAISEGNKEYAKASLEMSTLEKKLKNFNGTKKQEKQLVEELNRKYGDSIGQYKSVKEWKEAIIKKAAAYAQALRTEAEAQALLNLYTQQFVELEEAKQRQQQKDSSWVGWLEKAVDTVAKGVTKVNKQWGALATSMSAGLHLILDDNIDQMEANLEKTRELYDQKVAELGKIQAEYGLGDNAPKITENGKKTKAAVEKLQNEINQLELRLMKDGLNKKLKQLNEEERQTINKLKENGKKTNEAIQEIQRKYAQLRAKEIQDYLKNIEEKLKKSAQDIEKIQFEINTKTIEQNITTLENKVDTWKTKFEAFSFQPLTSNSDLEKLYKEEGKAYKENVNQLRNSFENRYEITKEFIGKTIDEETYFMQDEKALNEERINEQLKQDKQAEKERQRVLMSGLTENEETIKEAIEAIKKQYGQFRESGIAEGAFYIDDEKQKDNYGVLLVELAEVQEKIKTARQQHKDRMEQIEKDANDAIEKNNAESLKKMSEAQERYFGQQVTNYRDLVNKINDELEKSPIYNENTGIVDKEKTRKQYLGIINAAEEAFKTIEQDKKDLDRKLADGVITEEVCTATKKNLDEIKATIEEGYKEVLYKNVNVTSDYLKSLEMYLQAAAEMFTTILNGVFDAINNGFDKEQEELDKENEQMQDALEKRRQQIKDYSDEINSIEDELATSRGSRRQHLIDQLNAEMAAQRESVKEKQRLDKEEQKNKEQMQKKQDALDKKRRKAQWYQDLAQAVVNGALAVTYAAINKWPIPAIPLMELAAATTAAQLAVIAANHPFEKGGQLDGGVAVGARHRDGGIPVLGGRASIEGGEFITNRQTTAKNVDLLDYINSKHRKLNIDDFIDFYSSGKAKKNFMSSNPKTKFASGGALPTLNNDYNFDDRLLTAFEDYSNRPIYVAVTEIESKMDSVRNVRALAGMRED